MQVSLRSQRLTTSSAPIHSPVWLPTIFFLYTRTLSPGSVLFVDAKEVACLRAGVTLNLKTNGSILSLASWAPSARFSSDTRVAINSE